MLYSVLFYKFAKLIRCETRTVITNNRFRQPMCCEYLRQMSIVTSDVDELTTCASIHFEYASIKTNIIEPCIGPA